MCYWHSRAKAWHGFVDLEASGWSTLNMHGVCGPWTLLGWMLPLVHAYNVWLQKRLSYVLLYYSSKIVLVVFFQLVYNHGCMKLLSCMSMLWVPQWNDHQGGAKMFVERRKPRKRPYYLNVFTDQHTSSYISHNLCIICFRKNTCLGLARILYIMLYWKRIEASILLIITHGFGFTDTR